MRPFLLEHGYEDEVQLVQERAIGAAAVVVVGELDDEVYDKVADACIVSCLGGAKGGAEHTLTLVAREDLPPRHDHIVENLEPEVCALLAPNNTAVTTVATHILSGGIALPEGSCRREARHLGSL